MKLLEGNGSIRVLVTSAAGRTGIPTTLQLLDKGFTVRALVRREDGRAARLRRAGAEVVIGNLGDPRHMRGAMRGVRRAYFCAPTAPNALHYATVFALAAREAGVEHVVQLGQWLTHESHPSLFTREVHLSDQVMPGVSGATQTIVNVGWFAANYFFVMEAMAQLGMFPMPLGDGLNAPPSNEDIARVVVGALDRPDLHAGHSYRPTGPGLLSPEEIVDQISEALGRTVRYRPMSERMLLKALRADGWPIGMQTQFVQYLEEYRRGTFAVGGPTDAVKRVGGSEPEDFSVIAARYVTEDPLAKRTLRGRARAVRGLARAMVTRAIVPVETERDRDHVLLDGPEWSPESEEWARTHGAEGGHGQRGPEEGSAQSDSARVSLA